MLRVVLGAFAALSVVIAGVLLWLFWPLPSAEFDWRAIADARVERGECFEWALMFYSIPSVDHQGVQAYFEEASLAERCPSIVNSELSDGGDLSMVEVLELDIAEAVHRYREMERGSGREYGFRNGMEYWNRNRQLRMSGGAGFIAWPDLVIGLRCERTLRHGSGQEWLATYRSLAMEISAPTGIQAWLDRSNWCADYAARQLEIVTRGLDVSVKPAPPSDVHRWALAEDYERRARWWSLEETPRP